MKITEAQLRRLIQEQLDGRRQNSVDDIANQADRAISQLEAMTNQLDQHADRINNAGLHHLTSRWWKLLSRLDGLEEKLHNQLVKWDM